MRNFVKDFGHLKSGDHDKEKVLRVGARIYNKRASGNKLVFYDVRVEGTKVQIMCQAQEAQDEALRALERDGHPIARITLDSIEQLPQ